MSEQPDHEGYLLSLVEVPLLIGIPGEKAIAVISESGLRADPITTTESGRQTGTVIRQSPEPGSIVKPGTAVELVIASQIARTEPALTEEHDMIEQSGLESVSEHDSYPDPLSAESSDSIVVQQTPEANPSVIKKSSGILDLKTMPTSPLPTSPTPPLPTSISLTTTIIAIMVFTIMIVSIYLNLKQIISQHSLAGSNVRLSTEKNTDHRIRKERIKADS